MCGAHIGRPSSDYPSDTLKGHFDLLAWVRKTSDLGCHMCRVILHSRWDCGTPTSDGHLTWTKRLLGDAPRYLKARDMLFKRDGSNYYMCIATTAPDGTSWNLELVFVPCNQLPASFGPDAKVPMLVDVALSASMIKRWIEVRDSEHGKCASLPMQKQRSVLPTRLVEVTSIGRATHESYENRRCYH